MKAFVTLIASATALAALATGGAAEAAPRADRGMTISVSYGDLNLATEKGGRILHRRLVRASEHVCGGRSGRRSLALRRAFQVCFEDALNTAVLGLDRRTVSLAHTERFEWARDIDQSRLLARRD